MRTNGINQLAILAITLILALVAVSAPVSAIEPIPGYGVPADLNGDGLADDFNGDGVTNYDDAKILYDNRQFIADNYGAYASYFDYNRDGSANMNDVGYAYEQVKDTRVYDPVPGYMVPTDNNGDGLIDDFNGDGVSTLADVGILYENRAWIRENYIGELHHFDYDRNGVANYDDIIFACNALTPCSPCPVVSGGISVLPPLASPF